VDTTEVNVDEYAVKRRSRYSIRDVGRIDG
jgi:hypothetical protein